MSERFSVFTGITLDHLDKHHGRDTVETGEVDHWPTHITVSPPVAAEGSDQIDGFISYMETLLRQVEPFDARVGAPMMVGSSYELQATELQRNKLIVIHAMTLGALSYCGLDTVDPRWSGPNYRPHITHHPSSFTLQQGSTLRANDLSVYVKRTMRDDISRKLLVKRLPFGEE